MNTTTSQTHEQSDLTLRINGRLNIKHPAASSELQKLAQGETIGTCWYNKKGTYTRDFSIPHDRSERIAVVTEIRRRKDAHRAEVKKFLELNGIMMSVDQFLRGGR